MMTLVRKHASARILLKPDVAGSAAVIYNLSFGAALWLVVGLTVDHSC